LTAIKTLLWSIFVPGTVTLVVPYRLLSSRANYLDVEFSYLRLPGLLPIVAGVVLYIWCAWDFTFLGKGTPAPFDPPKELVVKGPYRYVRNPMYIFVGLTLAGEAIVFKSMRIAIFAIVALAFLHVWILLYEEPTLRRKFGEAYANYCRRVSRWLPRSQPE
jgi:protein-S-isoprenylcysteine O-methyltransferase Ste14